MSLKIQNPVQLYRYILRCIKKFPAESQEHYKHHLRQMYRSHGDETDTDRIRQIIDRALQDVEWLMNKYNKK